MTGDEDRVEGAADDLMELILRTAEEPAGHLEGHLTPRDAADLDLLHAGPQHAHASRRSADGLGRLLLLAVVLTVAALAVIVAAELVGSRVWRVAEQVAAWTLVVPGAVVLLLCLGCAALAAVGHRHGARR